MSFAEVTPPYAADTRARGWRFELDYEQIEQSSTWALAPAEAKPWLLMLWFTAWKQVPCGSLPADEAVVAALIGMGKAGWAKHSKVLLRGWSEVGGRLYHDTLSRRVQEMMKRRRSDSDRKAAERERKASESAVNPLGVTALSRVTSAGLTPDSTGVTRDSSTDNRQPNTKEEKKTLPAKAGEGRFPEFWNAYPSTDRKVDRKKCLAKWRLSKFDGQSSEILAHLDAIKPTRKWTEGFEPAPLRYLNGEQWRDGVVVQAQDRFAGAI